MSYSTYEHDDLEPASTMRIERRIYFESGKADLSEMVKLPLAELLSLRAESAAAEQEVFDRLKEQAAAWEEQAGRTLFLDKALAHSLNPAPAGPPMTGTAAEAGATPLTRRAPPGCGTFGHTVERMYRYHTHSALCSSLPDRIPGLILFLAGSADTELPTGKIG